jgi:hypothetical protein
MTIIRLCCPDCGELDNLGTCETLAGTAHATFHLEDGERMTDHTGWTDVFWDTSTTTGVTCRNCTWEGQIEDLLTPDGWARRVDAGEVSV